MTIIKVAVYTQVCPGTALNLGYETLKCHCSVLVDCLCENWLLLQNLWVLAKKSQSDPYFLTIKTYKNSLWVKVKKSSHGVHASSHLFIMPLYALYI